MTSILTKIDFLVDPATTSTVQETVDKTLAKLEEIQIAATNKDANGVFIKYYYGFVYDSRTDIKHYIFPTDTELHYGLTKKIFRDYEVIPSTDITTLNNQGATGTGTPPPQVITAAVGEGILNQVSTYEPFVIFAPYQNDVVIDSVTIDPTTNDTNVTLLCVGKNPKRSSYNTLNPVGGLSLIGAYEEVFFTIGRNSSTNITSIYKYTSTFGGGTPTALSSVITNSMTVKIYMNYVLFLNTSGKILYRYNVKTNVLDSLTIPGVFTNVYNFGDTLYITSPDASGLQSLYSVDINIFTNLTLIDKVDVGVTTTLNMYPSDTSYYYRKYFVGGTSSYINVNNPIDVIPSTSWTIPIPNNYWNTFVGFYNTGVNSVESAVTRPGVGKNRTVIINNNNNLSYDIHGYNYSTYAPTPFTFTDKYFYVADVTWGGTGLNSNPGFTSVTRVDRSNSLTYVGTFTSAPQVAGTTWTYGNRATHNTKILVPMGSTAFFNGVRPDVTLRLN